MRTSINTTVFFGDKGLSSTAAEHYVHIAEDLIETVESSIQSLGFVEEKVTLVGSDSDPKIVRRGMDISVMDSVMEKKIPLVATMHSFVAWCREALRRKADLLSRVENTTLSDYLRDVAGDCETADLIGQTYTCREYQPDDMLSLMDLDELCSYLSLETRCAELGKFVASSALRVASSKLNTALVTPMEVTGQGRDTVVREFTPTVDPAEFTRKLTQAQGLYREAQSSLNRIKHDLRKKADSCSEKDRQKMQDSCSRRDSARDSAMVKYRSWKAEQSEAVSSLRIAVPSQLAPVLDILKKAEKGEDVLTALL